MQMGTPGVQGGGARSPWGKEPHSGPRSRGVQGPPAPREQLEEAGEERTLGSWPGCPEDLSPGVAGSRGEGRTGGSLPHGMRGPGLQDVGGSGHTLRRVANRLPFHPRLLPCTGGGFSGTGRRAGVSSSPVASPARPRAARGSSRAGSRLGHEPFGGADRRSSANSRPARPESRRPGESPGQVPGCPAEVLTTAITLSAESDRLLALWETEIN